MKSNVGPVAFYGDLQDILQQPFVIAPEGGDSEADQHERHYASGSPLEAFTCQSSLCKAFSANKT